MTAPATATATDDRDAALMAQAMRLVERVLVPWHRATVRGTEHIPDGPALLVGNHNGATYSGDTWILAARIWRERGYEHLPWGLAHDLVLELPVIGSKLARMGVVPARPEAAERLLASGRKVLVYPGGDVESMRPRALRNVVCFGGRRGYIRTALRAGVPIVPIAAQGAHDTLYILRDFSGVARWLRADEKLRMKAWPLSLSVPWGLTLGPLPPYLPLPARMRIEVLSPIHFDRTGPAAAEDDAYVATCASTVEDLIQAAVLRLACDEGGS